MDAAQIVDVVSDFVTLRKRGVNYVGLCPFHNEKTPSFSVSPSKGLCKCFSCGKGGNAVHFIMEHEQMTYYEALKYLANKYHIEVKERELSPEEKQAQSERESMFVVNNFARDYFCNTLRNNPDGRAIGMAYFRSRGFRDDIIDKFQLGYCTEAHDAMAAEALRKGFKAEYLVKTGLCYETDDHRLRDRFWGRVIFPVHSLSGKVVAFGGRVLSSQTKGVKVKYVNSPESVIYHKSNELYGIYFAKQAMVKQDRCFLVEGYTDVISMHQSGVENVVASSGTALTSQQIRLIHRFTNNITVLYDGDKAGIKASIRGIDMLLEEGMNVKVCLLPDDDDPDSFARKHNSTEFQQFIADNETDFIRFKTNLLMEDAGKDPIKRAGLISDIVQSIAVIPEAIVRDVYIRECCQLLQLEDKLLVSEVAKRRGINVEKEKTQPQSFIPQESREEEEFYRYERLIIQAIVRYGERSMCTVTDENGVETSVSVIRYVVNDLKEDDLSFHNPIHRRILAEAVNHDGTEGFEAMHFFTSHPDPEISRVATELASDRYQLSKYHSKGQKILTDEERLYEIVPMLIVDFKNAIIASELKHLMNELRNPDVAADKDKCNELMTRFGELKKVENALAKRLGDRVVLPR
jgi:DNA primase